MPQLIIKGVSAQQTQQLAPKMIEVVSRLVECPEDWVTVELCESKFFDKNGPTEQYPIIQIWWYQRPLPVQNQVARELSELFLKEGFPLVQVSFHLFAESDYYEFEYRQQKEQEVFLLLFITLFSTMYPGKYGWPAAQINSPPLFNQPSTIFYSRSSSKVSTKNASSLLRSFSKISSCAAAFSASVLFSTKYRCVLQSWERESSGQPGCRSLAGESTI